jgi:hypothetical protein
VAKANRVQLVGGPLDGHEIAPRPGKYAWVAGKLHIGNLVGLRPLPGKAAHFLRGGSASSRPRDRSALYEDAGGGVLLYAGHRRYLCDCGAYHGKAEGGREKRPCALRPVAPERPTR